MSYLLDTDWAIDVLAGREPASSRLRQFGARRVSISRVTTAELYHGAYATPNPDVQLVSIRHLLASCRLLEITDPVAERFGEIRAYLYRRGEKLADLDLLIAATAIHHDLTLLTFNRRHFERVPGLRIYQAT